MKNPKTGDNRFVPGIRPEEIETYTETNGEQTANYKIVSAHPIISGILDKLAFFRTHAAAVYYNRLANKTVKQKFDEVDASVGQLNEKLESTYKNINSYNSMAQLVEETDANIFAIQGNKNLPEFLTANISVSSWMIGLVRKMRGTTKYMLLFSTNNYKDFYSCIGDTEEDHFTSADKLNSNSVVYEDKVITTDENGFYRVTKSDNVVNVIPMAQIDKHDVTFEITVGYANANFIRLKNPLTGEYYKGVVSCTARFYKLT